MGENFINHHNYLYPTGIPVAVSSYLTSYINFIPSQWILRSKCLMLLVSRARNSARLSTKHYYKLPVLMVMCIKRKPVVIYNINAT